MVDRYYGFSSYSPSPHRAQESKESTHHPHRKKFQKIAFIVGGIIAALLFLVWLFLGDFRFMLWRYASLSGFPFGNRTYLVLFQNNYELRPTGGFISTYGTLEFGHGFYKGLEFHDVYGEIDDHEPVEPPLVLGALLKGEGYEGHTFRDANFDPDFRISKDELIQFYQLTNPETRVDGVIAADFTFLEHLVGLYEPLMVEDYELTEQNLFETLSTVVSDIDRHNEEALENRKNITSPIVKKILTKTLIFPWRIHTVLGELSQAFNEKHVLAAFNRSGLAKSFEKRQWDGALPDSTLGDFLAINDANYGGMKTNRYLTRDVQYELEVTSAQDVLGNPVIKATAFVTLSHEGTWNIPLSGPYTAYLRTMIPIGANVEKGGTVSEDREDVLVLGEMVELEPGESVTYSYSYELPEYVWNNEVYYLHLHKQPGTEADHYRVVVRAPQGMSLDAPGFDVRENTAFFETRLITDANLSFSLLDDEDPPRVVSHEITALNEITVVFNEAVGTDFAGDPLLYEIVDINYANTEFTDKLIITNIQVDGAAVTITTEGMTEQPEERYELVLRDIQDINGNSITPNPRTLTVIQREDLAEEPLEFPELDLENE